MSYHDEMFERWWDVRDVPLNFVLEETKALAWNQTSKWISYWATQRLVRYFTEYPPPLNIEARQVWIDALLDNGKEKELLNWYKQHNVRQSNLDERAIFQAQYIISGYRNSSQEHEKYMQEAIEDFTGTDILPGYLRRTTAFIDTIEDLLSYFGPFMKNNSENHNMIFLALYDSIICSNTEAKPEFINGPLNCMICCEEIEEWNLMKLHNCKENDTFCLDCLNKSMSQGTPILRGICAGSDCNARANRREMEMVGMKHKVIYFTLRERYWQHVKEDPNLTPCPSCDFGAAVGKSKFCNICNVNVDVAAQNKDIIYRLLQGLQSSIVKGGDKIYRECYHCAAYYEKGVGCSTIECLNCKQTFNFSLGPKELNAHTPYTKGTPAQKYVPKVKGLLWKAGIFKKRTGKDLELGQVLSSGEQLEVLRRAKELEAEYSPNLI